MLFRNHSPVMVVTIIKVHALCLKVDMFILFVTHNSKYIVLSFRQLNEYRYIVTVAGP